MTKKHKTLPVFCVVLALFVVVASFALAQGYKYTGKTPQYTIEQIKQWDKVGMEMAACGPFFIYRNAGTGQIGYIHDCLYGHEKDDQFGYTVGETTENWVRHGSTFTYWNDPITSRRIAQSLMKYAPKE